MNTIDLIHQHLAVLEPTEINVIDDSHLHAGHAGAQSGGGHYRLKIISPKFARCSTMQKHRLVYDALASLMQGEIHALSIDARSTNETWYKQKQQQNKSQNKPLVTCVIYNKITNFLVSETSLTF